MTARARCIGSLAIAAAIAASPSALAEGEHHWSYSGDTGPARWASMEHDFAACGIGKTQSPIDIRDSDVKKAALPAIVFDYKPSDLRIVDNGHTIQVDYAPGSFITADGKRYQLLQFHFHKPSEEKINGRSAAMVAHLVHKDDGGHLAVVAVMLKPGQANRLVDTLWKNVPHDKEKPTAVDGVRIDANDLLPPNKAGYYTFTGSLTTPPCSEDVTWFVMKTPTSISNAEVTRFAQLYPMNARPTQPINGREIRATQ
jgi:carbonic anhydrase